MSNYPIHTCKATDEMGDPYRPEVVTCGSCDRSWCEACFPAPSAMCVFCNTGNPEGAGTANVPPRQVRALASMAPPESWQRRPRY